MRFAHCPTQAITADSNDRLNRITRQPKFLPIQLKRHRIKPIKRINPNCTANLANRSLVTCSNRRFITADSCNHHHRRVATVALFRLASDRVERSLLQPLVLSPVLPRSWHPEVEAVFLVGCFPVLPSPCWQRCRIKWQVNPFSVDSFPRAFWWPQCYRVLLDQVPSKPINNRPHVFPVGFHAGQRVAMCNRCPKLCHGKMCCNYRIVTTAKPAEDGNGFVSLDCFSRNLSASVNHLLDSLFGVV